MKSIRALALPVVATVLLAGCGSQPGPSSAASPTPRLAGVVTQTSTDCSLSLTPGAIKSGPIACRFVNQSGDRAGLDVWRMPEASSFQSLVVDAQDDRRRAEAGEPPQGDHSALGSAPSIRADWDSAPSRTVSGRLEPGTYALVCIATFPKVSEPRLLKVVGPVVVEPA
jgi:hypothetical protein